MPEKDSENVIKMAEILIKKDSLRMLLIYLDAVGSAGDLYMLQMAIQTFIRPEYKDLMKDEIKKVAYDLARTKEQLDREQTRH